jgi:hypothetical protein
MPATISHLLDRGKEHGARPARGREGREKNVAKQKIVAIFWALAAQAAVAAAARDRVDPK